MFKRLTWLIGTAMLTCACDGEAGTTAAAGASARKDESSATRTASKAGPTGTSSLAGSAGAAASAGAARPAHPAQPSLAASAPGHCIQPDPNALKVRWEAFRRAALDGKPEEVSRYVRFPVKLESPFDGDRPLTLSAQVFVQNYAELFRVARDGSEMGLYKNLKQDGAKASIPTVPFDAQRCIYKTEASILDYNFRYRPKDGWMIESIEAGSDFFTITATGADKLD